MLAHLRQNELGDTYTRFRCVRSTDMEPYSTLINRRLVFPSTRDEYVIIEKTYLFQVLFSMTSQIFVDEKWYSNRYPDVLSALDEGNIKNVAEHYALFGYYEHRMPYHIGVDEDWYLAQYQDVSKAVDAQIYESGQRHFEECGYREGRIPYANFRLKLRNDEPKKS